MDAVKRVVINQAKYFELIKALDAKDILVFSPDTYNEDHDLNVRMFAFYHGIPEDAATGSANGCLAGYLIEHRYFNSDSIDICVEQGYEIKRRSKLNLKADNTSGKININVGGKVQMIAQGEFV